MNPAYSITIKQRVDGQIQVTSIRVSKDILDEDPFIKSELKREMEDKLKENGIKVLEDIGVVEYD